MVMLEQVMQLASLPSMGKIQQGKLKEMEHALVYINMITDNF